MEGNCGEVSRGTHTQRGRGRRCSRWRAPSRHSPCKLDPAGIRRGKLDPAGGANVSGAADGRPQGPPTRAQPRFQPRHRLSPRGSRRRGSIIAGPLSRSCELSSLWTKSSRSMERHLTSTLTMHVARRTFSDMRAFSLNKFLSP